MTTLYEMHRKVLIAYLSMKVEQKDWHGVADAANDLRELEAEQRGRDDAKAQTGDVR